MKWFITVFLFCFSAWMPLQAQTTYTLSLKGSNIEINTSMPAGYQEEEDEYLDLLFLNTEDESRRIAFHYFGNADFQTSSLQLVYEYTEWLVEQLQLASEWSRTSISTASDYATTSFAATDADGAQIYCYIYVGKIEGKIVFASISTSSQSLEDAINDNIEYLKQVNWN